MPPTLSEWEDPAEVQAQAEKEAAAAAEPSEPSDVERVSEHTPNPPTAAIPTTPEHPATIDLQLQQLGQHLRKVVMLPRGTPPPMRYPPGVAITSDSYGNIYAYDPGQIKKSAIHSAAKRNKLPEILGSTQLGLGAPDKAALPPDAPVVTAHAADGTEAQSTATSPEALPLTIAATQAVTPPGGRVSIGRAPQVLRGRLYQGVQQPEPLPDLAAPAAF